MYFTHGYLSQHCEIICNNKKRLHINSNYATHTDNIICSIYKAELSSRIYQTKHLKGNPKYNHAAPIHTKVNKYIDRSMHACSDEI
jgi:hypothetical protein